MLLLSLNSKASDYLNIYNWAGYILPEQIEQFEKETGIKVRYDLYDSDYILEAKLISGKTGYDIVFPSLSPFLNRQIKLGLYHKLDKAKIPNYSHIDPLFLDIMHKYGESDQYAIPWIWSAMVVGYNEKKLKEIFPDAIPNNLELIFEEEYLRKVENCGIAIADSPNDIIALISIYNKLDPNKEDESTLKIIEQTLHRIKPYIKYFHGSRYIDDLANGEICVAVGYSADIFQAAAAADEIGQNKIGYFVPDEGSLLSIDSAVILKDAPNMENAYKFINFILNPQISAAVTNKYRYANTISASKAYINNKVLKKYIYPNEKNIDKLHIKRELSSSYERQKIRLWMYLLSK